jgi:hypothetical protein
MFALLCSDHSCFAQQAESIEWFLEDQAFSPSYDLAHPRADSLPLLLSASWLSFSVTGRAYWGGRGWGRSQIIRRRGSLVLYNHSILLENLFELGFSSGRVIERSVKNTHSISRFGFMGIGRKSTKGKKVTKHWSRVWSQSVTWQESRVRFPRKNLTGGVTAAPCMRKAEKIGTSCPLKIGPQGAYIHSHIHTMPLPCCMWGLGQRCACLFWGRQGVTRRCRQSSWPIATLVNEPKCGGGGCGVSANENSCAYHVTWSPNKLWRSNSIFNLWGQVSMYERGVMYI